jgi:hypothetical protein
MSTPKSCAETPSSKDGDASVSAEVEAVALALEKDGEEEVVAVVEAEDGGDDGDADWVEEERKLREENNKREEENRKKNNKMGMKEKVALLDNLLQKAAAYTAFLRERMKDATDKESGAGAAPKKSPKKRDGQFEHQERDERQPKLVQGVMRKYQIEGLMWICSLYENGLNGILAGTCAICVPGQPRSSIPPVSQFGTQIPHSERKMKCSGSCSLPDRSTNPIQSRPTYPYAPAAPVRNRRDGAGENRAGNCLHRTPLRAKGQGPLYGGGAAVDHHQLATRIPSVGAIGGRAP